MGNAVYCQGSSTMMNLFDPMQTLKISSLLWHEMVQALLKQKGEQTALLEPFALVSSAASFASSYVCLCPGYTHTAQYV